MIWSSRSVPPLQNFDAHLFHVQKKALIFMIYNDFNTCMVLGPRPLGPMGPFVFLHFLNFVLWSGTYLEVFLGCLGVQGTP